MKKAIIFTILILSLVITGCVSKTSPALENVGEQTVDDKKYENVETPASPTSQGGQKQMTEDQDVMQTEPSTKVVEGTEGWRTYEKQEKNVRLKYHKDWYHDRDESAEKELGYNLYVGFAESPEILEQGTFYYLIQFIIVPNSIKLSQAGYSKIITERDNKKYILVGQEKYKDIIDKMVESFEFLDELDEVDL